MIMTLDLAERLVASAFSAAKKGALKPLAIVVLDVGGHDVLVKRQDGAAFLRTEVARAKAWGALGLGMNSRMLGARAEQNPRFYAALASLTGGRVIPNAGGVLVKTAGGDAIGSLGASGDHADQDEAVLLEALRGAGLATSSG